MFANPTHAGRTSVIFPRLAAIVAFSGSLLAGCGDANIAHTYVGTSDIGVFTKVPSEWGSGQADELVEENSVGQSVLVGAVQAFAAPGGSLDLESLSVANSVPMGIVLRRVSPDDGTSILETSRNIWFPLDMADVQGVLSYSEGPQALELFDLPGEKLVFDAFGVEIPGSGELGVLRVMQVTVFDASADEAYGILVGCSVECFDKNRATIDSIVKHFRVKP